MKKYLIILIPIISIYISYSCYYYISTTSFFSYDVNITVDEENNLILMQKENIKILHLSDIQSSTLTECQIGYPMIEKVIKRTHPDLIIFTGDNISNGSSRLLLDTFINYMDGFNIPWTVVFGNHDRNSNVSVDAICNAYEKCKNSLFKKGNVVDSYGSYYYNIEYNNKNIFSLIFMDSRKDGFSVEQIKWYEDIMINNMEQIPNFVFFHIPIYETVLANEEYKNDSSIGSGILRSEVRHQPKETNFFNILKKYNNTKGLFYGHDHLNDTLVKYEDVYFCYAVKTGRTVYWDNDSLGGTLITINKDQSFIIDRIYV